MDAAAHERYLQELPWEQNPGIPEGAPRSARLYHIRHSLSHIMAQAVLKRFPETKYTIGPPIANGFYYDFDIPEHLTMEDLAGIEKDMKKIIKRNWRFSTCEVSKDQATEIFTALDQPYKLKIMDRIPGDTVRLYKQDTFIDLCAGPHVNGTKECKHFKLLNLAGSYWEGNAENQQLQRIYGTAWESAEDLEQYMAFLEESKARDHRSLGPKLGLFFFHEYSPGNCFWQPKGVTLLNRLREYSRDRHQEAGYVEISNPVIYRKELFETSGHWDFYKDDMFVLEQENEPTMALKPMNCPDTMLFFKHRKRSYRELPLRVSEMQMLHRNEATGTLHGLLRARCFCQDDAHIFVSNEQILPEIKNVLGLVEQIYGLFEMRYDFTLSTRPEKFMGDSKVWDAAEEQLRRAFADLDIPYVVDEGGGAFYGPKIDFKVHDALGRVWQTATIQLDFQLPERFELEYVGADNEMHRPIVIHRAVFGSIERFLGILIEHLGGAFPTWLAPVQAIILPITDDMNDYAFDVAKELVAAGLRVEVDHRSEKIGYKIREAELLKVPSMVVVGKKEHEAGTVAVRTYKDGEKGTMPVADLIADMRQKVESYALDVNLVSFAHLFEEEEQAVAENAEEY